MFHPTVHSYFSGAGLMDVAVNFKMSHLLPSRIAQ